VLAQFSVAFELQREALQPDFLDFFRFSLD